MAPRGRNGGPFVEPTRLDYLVGSESFCQVKVGNEKMRQLTLRYFDEWENPATDFYRRRAIKQLIVSEIRQQGSRFLRRVIGNKAVRRKCFSEKDSKWKELNDSDAQKLVVDGFRKLRTRTTTPEPVDAEDQSDAESNVESNVAGTSEETPPTTASDGRTTHPPPVPHNPPHQQEATKQNQPDTVSSLQNNQGKPEMFLSRNDGDESANQVATESSLSKDFLLQLSSGRNAATISTSLRTNANWDCQACHYSNAATSQMCAVCGGWRQSYVSTNGTVSGGTRNMQEGAMGVAAAHGTLQPSMGVGHGFGGALAALLLEQYQSNILLHQQRQLEASLPLLAGGMVPFHQEHLLANVSRGTEQTAVPLNFSRVFEVLGMNRNEAGSAQLIASFGDTLAGIRDLMAFDGELLDKILQRIGLSFLDRVRLGEFQDWFRTCYLPASMEKKPVFTKDVWLAFREMRPHERGSPSFSFGTTRSADMEATNTVGNTNDSNGASVASFLHEQELHHRDDDIARKPAESHRSSAGALAPLPSQEISHFGDGKERQSDSNRQSASRNPCIAPHSALLQLAEIACLEGENLKRGAEQPVHPSAPKRSRLAVGADTEWPMPTGEIRVGRDERFHRHENSQ